MAKAAPGTSPVGPHGAARPQFPDGAADIARRFGISIKALRVYEAAGLVRPVRDAHGWRTYGQAECERLHLILLLRQLGLTVARIGDLLGDGSHDLAAVLAIQEQALLEQRARADEALGLVRIAQARLAGGQDIDPAALADLVRRTRSGAIGWTPRLADLANRLFSEAQRARFAQADRGLAAGWAAIYGELRALAAIGDPASPAARALGLRARALIDQMSDGDPATQAAMADFWRQGFADPQSALALPITEAEWRFLGRAMFGDRPSAPDAGPPEGGR